MGGADSDSRILGGVIFESRIYDEQFINQRYARVNDLAGQRNRWPRHIKKVWLTEKLPATLYSKKSQIPTLSENMTKIF